MLLKSLSFKTLIMEKMISFLVGKMKGQYIKKGLTQEAENLNMRARYKNLEKEKCSNSDFGRVLIASSSKLCGQCNS